MIYPESPRLPHGRGAASRRAHALRGLPRLAPLQAVAGAVKETSQGTFAKGVDTKWPETQTVAKGVTSLLPRKSDEIFNFKPPPRRQETVSVPPRG